VLQDAGFCSTAPAPHGYVSDRRSASTGGLLISGGVPRRAAAALEEGEPPPLALVAAAAGSCGAAPDEESKQMETAFPDEVCSWNSEGESGRKALLHECSL
jgi:hypothetical protein